MLGLYSSGADTTATKRGSVARGVTINRDTACSIYESHQGDPLGVGNEPNVGRPLEGSLAPRIEEHHGVGSTEL